MHITLKQVHTQMRTCTNTCTWSHKDGQKLYLACRNL
uniref:Uncharacterized protein n=1 Tax=Rhizophora mucronata TaxID=61149 RepID=A0A2P2QJI3_RHIMU